MDIMNVIISIIIVAVLLGLAGIGVAFFGRVAWYGITHLKHS